MGATLNIFMHVPYWSRACQRRNVTRNPDILGKSASATGTVVHCRHARARASLQDFYNLRDDAGLRVFIAKLDCVLIWPRLGNRGQNVTEDLRLLVKVAE